MLSPVANQAKTEHGPSIALAILLAIVIALSFVGVPEIVASTDIDESWIRSLGDFFKQQRQAGVDYIFTYGPFGFFPQRTYEPDLFWFSFAWEIVVKFLCAFLVVWVALQSPGWAWKLLLVAIAAVVFEPGLPEAIFYVSLLAALISMVKMGRCLPAILLLSAFLIAVISLVKFTYLLYVAATIPFVELAYRSKRPRAILSPLVLVGLFFLAAWIATGQDIRNLPRYIYGSLQIAIGYSDAMSLPAGATEKALGISAAVVLGLLVLALAVRPRITTERLAGLAIFGAGLVLTWKHGFTRGDPAHNAVFFVTAMFLAGFLPAFFAPERPALAPTYASVGACIVICQIGFNEFMSIFERVQRRPQMVRDIGSSLLSPMAQRQQLESRRLALEKTWQLPAIQEKVRDAPVDLFGYEQGVLFLNHLNYRPRPILHSYSVYTPYLLAKNAEYFRSANAPEYVLYRFESLHDVYPTQLDGQAFLEFLWRYRPIMGERSFIFFEKCPDRPQADRPEGRVVFQEMKGFSEHVDLSRIAEPYLTLALDIKPTLKGRAKGLLYKTGHVKIEVHFAEGPPRVYRILPRIAHVPFLLSPLLADRDDVLRLFANQPGKRVTGLRVLCDDPSLYDSDINVTIRAPERLVDCPISTQLLDNLLRQPKELRQFDGVLEVVDAERIAGWAFDRNMPDEPIEVDVFVDDEMVGVIPANEPRPDLTAKGLDGHGFSYGTPERLKDGKPHTIRIQPSGSSDVLRGSPRTIVLPRP